MTNDNVFLVGLQHLDFNDQGTLEEIRKINPAYAVVKHVAAMATRTSRPTRRVTKSVSDRAPFTSIDPPKNYSTICRLPIGAA